MMFRATHFSRSVIIITTLVAGAIKADAWPRLAGETSDPHCVQAYRLATAAFRSTDASLFGPFEPPDGLGSTISLDRTEKDISAGGGVDNDTNVFSNISAPVPTGGALTIFWQDRPRNGKRIAVVDRPFNWQGDWYSIYLIGAEASSKDLAKDLETADEASRKYKPILADRWNPPLVLTDDESGASWFIDVGEPYPALADWQVYTVDAGVARSPCRISFRPNVKSTVSLMPEPVQQFAASLDSVLGSGRDEGDLHPTARIRFNVALAWANAGVRPWALTDGPYNTREEVDEGLKQWAFESTKRKAVYDDIRRQYAGARDALTEYYESRFKLQPKAARDMGAYVIDMMYRQYLVFPHPGNGNPPKSAKNPWPVELR
jgi:hypothetical protein